MRILHITQSDYGGAGLCCLRIHQSLLDQGIESKVVVYNKTTKNTEVYRYGNRFRLLVERTISKFFDMLGLVITDRNRMKEMSRKYKSYYSSPFSPIDLTKCELLQWADVIHLHWISMYVDYPSFFSKVQKPIVWTLHDENLFCGAAHFTKDIISNNLLEIKYKNLKQQIIGPLQNINIVFLSEFMYNKFHNYHIIENKRKVVINNSVDTSKYHIYNKIEMRKLFGISSETIVFAFLAYEILEKRKGLEILIAALKNQSHADKMKILAIGGCSNQHDISDIVIPVGRINDSDKLSRLLSCADYFAMPSYQEAFAQSPMEAMACGLPVVAFPCSGTKELIHEHNGVVCEDFTQEALENGIKKMLQKDFDAELIRKDIIDRFSAKKISKKYIEFYRQAIES